MCTSFLSPSPVPALLTVLRPADLPASPGHAQHAPSSGPFHSLFPQSGLFLPSKLIASASFPSDVSLSWVLSQGEGHHRKALAGVRDQPDDAHVPVKGIGGIELKTHARKEDSAFSIFSLQREPRGLRTAPDKESFASSDAQTSPPSS